MIPEYFYDCRKNYDMFMVHVRSEVAHKSAASKYFIAEKCYKTITTTTTMTTE